MSITIANSAFVTSGTGPAIYVSGNGQYYINSSTTSTTASTTTFSGSGLSVVASSFDDDVIRVLTGNQKVQPNSTLEFDDGTIIEVDDMGNFKIIDKDATVIYQGCKIREFNPFINASDQLEDFIRDLGKLGVKQSEVLNVPIDLFINWLICKAAEQDGDIVPTDVPRLETTVKKQKNRCKCCGRYIQKKLIENDIYFCNPKHHKSFLKKMNL